MSFLDSNNILRYAVVLTILAVSAYVGNQIKKKYATSDPKKDYELVQVYLLNESPLYGHNKPKLWIHSKYEFNARKWESFGTRNSTDLNQPYINITVKSILHHCADDFHVMLIDDESFPKLLPDWQYGSLSTVPEPFKTQYRQIGLAMLIYKYGGMVVPNSFVCIKNMKTMYETGTSRNMAFVGESYNRTTSKPGNMFLPNLYFFGAEKRNDSIFELIEYLQGMVHKGHFSDESMVIGNLENWLVSKHEWFHVLDGDLIGIKTYKKRRQILIEDLIEEKPIDLSPECYGIYIDESEVLKRTKYQWFAVMSIEELLNSNMILAKYLKQAAIDMKSEYATVTIKKEKHSESAI